MEKELVIARYREDTSWLDRVHIPWVIYDKSGNSSHASGNTQAIALPNVGREGHTYLYHIVARYDSLAPLTIFSQEDPFDHSVNFVSAIRSASSVDFCFLGDWIGIDDDQGYPSHLTTQFPFSLPLSSCYSELLQTDSPRFFLFGPGALFAVSRSAVLRRPRRFYEKCLSLLENPGWEILGYVFERLWQYIFADNTCPDVDRALYSKSIDDVLQSFDRRTMFWDGTVVTDMAGWHRTHRWGHGLHRAQSEIWNITRPGQKIILVDENHLGFPPGGSRHITPFPELEGQYGGRPADSSAAVMELERLRCQGSSWIVFAWPAFWWLDYYTEFAQYLRGRFPCVLQNERLVVFDLRG